MLRAMEDNICLNDSFIIALAFFIILLSSCAPVPVNTPTGPPILPPIAAAPPVEKTSTDKYTIQVGDKIEVDFFENNDLDQVMNVLPDGYVSLLLVGDVKASGLTVAELIKILEEKYRSELIYPRINVRVHSFSPQVVFVGGGVRNPSAINYKNDLTVLQAITLAGGFTEEENAIISQVVVIRRQPGNIPQYFIVDLSRVIDGSDLMQDIYLVPLDTIFVPSSKRPN